MSQTSTNAAYPGLPREIDGPLAVIGDLHGADSLLERLLAKLRQSASFADRWLVFVGDFLDRGPDCRSCLDRILDLRDRHGKVAACMGNHDLAAVAAMGLVPTPRESNWDLRYLADYDSWETFSSYGVLCERSKFNKLIADVKRVKPYFHPHDPRYKSWGVVPPDLEELRDATLAGLADLLCQLRERMPPRHRAFLADLPWCVEHPQYLVVHAGLKPDRPLAEQLEVLRRRDFSLGQPPWLHDRGLTFALPPADCPLTVVSGHVVVPEVRFLHDRRRILVDTFGGSGSVLSAVLLPEGDVVTSEE